MYGRSIPKYFKKSNLVSDLVNEICLEFCCKKKDFRLLYDCKDINDEGYYNRNLNEINLFNGHNLHFTMRLLGGYNNYNFIDISKNLFEDILFSEKASKWRIAGKGINFEGECKNYQCVAFKQSVISSIDNEIFDLIHDLKFIKCPMCETNFEPDNIAFSNCKYSWRGIDENNNEFKNSEEIIVGNYFRIFDKSQNGTRNWRQLKFIIDLDKDYSNYSTNEKNDSFITNSCNICLKPESNSKLLISYNCKHNAHRSCVSKLPENLKYSCCLVCF